MAGVKQHTDKETTMERQAIADTMSGFLKRALANKDAQINPDVSLREQGLSSSGRLEFLTMCEDEWSLFFEEDDLEKVATFNQAVDLVVKMIAGQ
jgi:acyl carrier protein